MMTEVEMKEDASVMIDHLYRRIGRLQSHAAYLKRCLLKKDIPSELRLSLIPCIGRHDEVFLNKWNARLLELSAVLVKDIIDYCDTNIESTIEEINTVEYNVHLGVNRDMHGHTNNGEVGNMETNQRHYRHEDYKSDENGENDKDDDNDENEKNDNNEKDETKKNVIHRSKKRKTKKYKVEKRMRSSMLDPVWLNAGSSQA